MATAQQPLSPDIAVGLGFVGAHFAANRPTLDRSTERVATRQSQMDVCSVRIVCKLAFAVNRYLRWVDCV